MLKKIHLIMLPVLLSLTVSSPAQQPPASQPATTSRPVSATNPYVRVPNPAAPTPNPRDQLPFTNSNPATVNAALPTLFIAGDSTAATGNATTRGWAALLIDYFDTSKVNLVNMAVGGTRFNTYTPTWDRLLAAVKPGDFVVIQMGHNSGPLAGIGEETQGAIHTHGWYVRKYIADVREKKATPIPTTLTLRDLWKDGKVERLKELTTGTGTGMSDWTRQVATAEKTQLLDHSNIIGDMYDKLGPVATDKLFGDHYLHTNTAGAILNCEAFIAGLKSLPHSPLAETLNEKGKAIPAYQPATPSTPAPEK